MKTFSFVLIASGLSLLGAGCGSHKYEGPKTPTVRNGETVTLSGRVSFVFWTDPYFTPRRGYKTVKDARESVLTDGYKIDAPAGVKVTVEDVSVRLEDTSHTTYQGRYRTTHSYKQYVITCKAKVAVPKDHAEGEHKIKVTFPGVALVKRAFRAIEPAGETTIELAYKNMKAAG
jgi:hypothetical protein